jgi:RNA polymerase sigma factor (sigma-70 family)
MNQDDKPLVLATLQGEKAAFVELFHKYRRMVQAMAFKMTGSGVWVNDIVQETFMRAFKQLPNLEKPEHFGSWLGSICKNVANEHFREQKVTSLTSPPFSVLDMSLAAHSKSSDEQVGLTEEDRKELFDIVESLPEIYREVILLKYFNNLSYREIGLLLNLSDAGVNARLAKARAILKKKLGKLQK